MCNLYTIFPDRAALARMFGVTTELTGNRPPLPAISPTSARR